jgi:type IV fimbrial biogenesis protein FimT
MGTFFKPVGFTLVELLVGMAIVYVVLGFAAPSAKRIVDSHRMAANINHTSALLRFARNHAISHYETTKVCPAKDFIKCTKNWTEPLIVFTDLNNNNVRDQNERLLSASSAAPKQHKIAGPKSAIRFFESGENASPGSIVICPVSNDNTLARALYVSLQGRIRLSVDYNRDGIHERVKKVNLACVSF